MKTTRRKRPDEIVIRFGKYEIHGPDEENIVTIFGVKWGFSLSQALIDVSDIPQFIKALKKLEVMLEK